jgi:DNA modification methylase
VNDKKYAINDIIQADAKNLSEYVKPNSVALTITSPPYRNAINYSQHVENLNKQDKTRFRGNVGLTTEEYLDEMEQIFSEVLKVTVPGGFCCIVIGDEVDNGKLIPLSSLLISRLVKEEYSEHGWHLRDMIIWNKVTAGRNGAGNRFGIFVQHPMPTYYRSNIMHEYIIVLEKGSQRRGLDRKNTQQIPLNRAMKRQVSLSIWDITPVPPRSITHPAVFPEQIPWRLIQLYSTKGDVVLDPMNGSGQTTKAAKKLGRKFIGIDIRKPYVEIAKRRLNEPFVLSNFMTPVYLPIKWTDSEESGKKEDAHLDAPEIPKGYKSAFKTLSAKEVRGVRGTYLYFKNREGDYLCYIMGRDRQKPTTKMKLGNLANKRSSLQITLKKLPKKFHKAMLNSLLPPRLVENRQPIKAIIDVLEHEGFIRKTGRKIKAAEEYEKILPLKQKKLRKEIATIIKLREKTQSNTP